jgi:putative transcriptional regulator
MKSSVRTLRETAKLPQAALGEVLGVSRQTINSIETGKYDPSLTLAVRLARLFDSTVEEVFDVDRGATMPTACWRIERSQLWPAEADALGAGRPPGRLAVIARAKVVSERYEHVNPRVRR